MSHPKIWAAALLFVLAAGLAVYGQPTLEDRLAQIEAKLDADVAARLSIIDPGELLKWKHDRDYRCVLLDVRSEADFNLFHIIDAKRIDPVNVETPFLEGLDDLWIKVVMSNDEAAAIQTWKRLRAAGMRGVYVLGGGINLWLDVYKDGKQDSPADRPSGNDRLRHAFPSAVGSRHPAANPNPEYAPKRTYRPKVKPPRPPSPTAGGCG